MNTKLVFSKEHIWVRFEEDGTVKIGISDYAQEQLGCVMFLNLPDEGDHIVCGEAMGDIESIKTVSDLIAPVTGTVVEINEDLCDDTSLINESPYESWFCSIKPEGENEELLTEDEYAEYLNENSL